MNPFKYGDPVKGDYLFVRANLKKSVRSLLENQINVVLVGPRRFGKTSFILDLLDTLEKDGCISIYVDIFNVTTHRDFLQQLLNSISKKQKSITKIKRWFAQFSKQIQPELSIDQDSFRFSLSEHKLSNENIKQLILDAFDTLGELGHRVCIVFDEFQTVGYLDDSGWLEATIRSKMQLTKNVAFLFSGSRHGMINDMFNNSSRPFFRSCQMIDFPPIGEEFTSWIIDRFKSIDMSVHPDAINYLRQLVADTPNYIQMACFHIVAGEYKIVDRQCIDTILRQMVQQNSYAYQTLLNTLTLIQQRVLRMVATEKRKIFSKDSLEKYEIQTGAHVSQAINSLSQKQILESGPGRAEVRFDDPLFAIWLRFEFEAYR